MLNMVPGGAPPGMLLIHLPQQRGHARRLLRLFA
jgi:hypothetical protein